MDNSRVGELQTVENLLHENQRLRDQCRRWKRASSGAMLIGCGILCAAIVSVSSAEDKDEDRATFTHKTTKDTPYHRHSIVEEMSPLGTLEAGSQVHLVKLSGNRNAHFIIEAVADADNLKLLGTAK